MIKSISNIWFVLIIFLISGCDKTSRDALDKKAYDTLLNTLDNNDRWVGIHAAEHLIDLGCIDKIKEYFRDRLENYTDTPQYRIGIWRVLARSAGTEAERNEWIE